MLIPIPLPSPHCASATNLPASKCMQIWWRSALRQILRRMPMAHSPKLSHPHHHAWNAPSRPDYLYADPVRRRRRDRRRRLRRSQNSTIAVQPAPKWRIKCPHNRNLSRSHNRDRTTSRRHGPSSHRCRRDNRRAGPKETCGLLSAPQKCHAMFFRCRHDAAFGV